MEYLEQRLEARKNIRLERRIPVTLTLTGCSEEISYNQPVVTRNISEGGMLLELGLLKDRPSRLLVKEYLYIKLDLPTTEKSLNLKLQIVWLEVQKEAYKVGVTFSQILKEEKEIIALYIKKELVPRIKSELISYKNKRGKTIIGFYDQLDGEFNPRPFIVIPPVYGETKANSLSLAYFLASNGFRVVRYDNTDHIGESDGEMVDFTLSKAKEDLISTLDFVEDNFGANEFGVVARCLASTSALKAATDDLRIKLLISLVGVVSLQYTLFYAYREDLVGNHIKGKKWGITDILGFDINFDKFLKTSVDNQFHNLETTINDISKLNIPFIYLFAEKDIWVKFEEVKRIFESINNHNSELHIIPNAVHMLYENPEAATQALKQIVTYCQKYFYKRELRQDEVIKPNLRDIAFQSRLEKERLKRYDFNKIRERNFWSKYLTKHFIIDKSQDYRNYLDLLKDLLGELRGNEFILDAGCGNGLFGAWLLRSILKIQLLSLPCIYVGLDFVEGALRESIVRHEEIRSRFLRRFRFIVNGNLPAYFYVCADLAENNICFNDDIFDKICCSFVISHVKYPLTVVRELLRIVKPNRKLVITSLKPYADLSQIYRNFVDQTENYEEIEEARGLLNAAGRIKQKEAEGLYHFFSEEELKALVSEAGGKKVKTYRSLAGQANIVVAEK